MHLLPIIMSPTVSDSAIVPTTARRRRKSRFSAPPGAAQQQFQQPGHTPQPTLQSHLALPPPTPSQVAAEETTFEQQQFAVSLSDEDAEVLKRLLKAGVLETLVRETQLHVTKNETRAARRANVLEDEAARVYRANFPVDSPAPPAKGQAFKLLSDNLSTGPAAKELKDEMMDAVIANDLLTKAIGGYEEDIRRQIAVERVGVTMDILPAVVSGLSMSTAQYVASLGHTATPAPTPIKQDAEKAEASIKIPLTTPSKLQPHVEKGKKVGPTMTAFLSGIMPSAPKPKSKPPSVLLAQQSSTCAPQRLSTPVPATRTSLVRNGPSFARNDAAANSSRQGSEFKTMQPTCAIPKPKENDDRGVSIPRKRSTRNLGITPRPGKEFSGLGTEALAEPDYRASALSPTFAFEKTAAASLVREPTSLEHAHVSVSRVQTTYSDDARRHVAHDGDNDDDDNDFIRKVPRRKAQGLSRLNESEAASLVRKPTSLEHAHVSVSRVQTKYSDDARRHVGHDGDDDDDDNDFIRKSCRQKPHGLSRHHDLSRHHESSDLKTVSNATAIAAEGSAGAGDAADLLAVVRKRVRKSWDAEGAKEAKQESEARESARTSYLAARDTKTARLRHSEDDDEYEDTLDAEEQVEAEGALPLAAGVVTSTLVDDEAKFMRVREALEFLMKLQAANPFLEPVNENMPGCADYYVEIQKPMNLCKIHDRLGRKEYKNVSAVFDDVDLVWRNCFQYNARGDQVCHLAEECKVAFELRVKGEIFDDQIRKSGRQRKPKRQAYVLEMSEDEKRRVVARTQRKAAKIASRWRTEAKNLDADEIEDSFSNDDDEVEEEFEEEEALPRLPAGEELKGKTLLVFCGLDKDANGKFSMEGHSVRFNQAIVTKYRAGTDTYDIFWIEKNVLAKKQSLKNRIYKVQ
jgi:Bromodomain